MINFLKQFFTITLLFVLFGATTSYAQNESGYKKASNANIKEAQNYYDICKNSDVISKRKDCKCAATALLETRLKLGDKASRQDVLNQNIDTCLINSAQISKGTAKESKPSDLSEVSDKDLEEAEGIFQKCTITPKFHNLFNCECYAAKFLDKRIELGPLPNADVVMSHLKGECPNVVNATGAYYQNCMTGGLPSFVKFTQKDYCECTARKFGKFLEAASGPSALDFRHLTALRREASFQCTQPEAYQEQ